MGYTNYWHQKSDFTDNQWSKVKMEADYVRSWSELPQIKKVCEVEIHKDEIIIWGQCESMHIKRYARTKPAYEGEDITFNFCKTREQVYDLAVWHMLVACAFVKSDFTISRDNHNFTESLEAMKVNGKDTHITDEAVNG